MDEIRIDNLSVYAYHGVYAEENKLGQMFYINAVLYTDTRKAGICDELTYSTNYGDVCHFITRWMKENTCKLIEAAAEGLAGEILLQYPLIRQVQLEIRKPQAPVGLPLESVSVRIERKWHKAYLSFGSNMGEKENYILSGIEKLRENKQIRVLKVSSLIATKPYGNTDQDDFLNGCLLIETLYSPKELLDEIHRIEHLAGRERLIHWGPRTLDLDILLYDNLIYEDEELIIPHVDMENRQFVLEPMTEIAPNLRHPVLLKTMKQLYHALRYKD